MRAQIVPEHLFNGSTASTPVPASTTVQATIIDAFTDVPFAAAENILFLNGGGVEIDAKDASGSLQIVGYELSLLDTGGFPQFMVIPLNPPTTLVLPKLANGFVCFTFSEAKPFKWGDLFPVAQRANPAIRVDMFIQNNDAANPHSFSLSATWRRLWVLREFGYLNERYQ